MSYKLPVVVVQVLNAARKRISILRIVFAVTAKQKKGVVGDGIVTHRGIPDGMDIFPVTFNVIDGI